MGYRTAIIYETSGVFSYMVNPIVWGQTSPLCKVHDLMGSMAALCKTSYIVCWLSKWTSSFWPRKSQCKERWLYLTSENEVLFVIHITAQYDWTCTNVRNKAWNKHSVRNPNTDPYSQSSIGMRLELRTGEDVSVEKGGGGGTALLAAADWWRHWPWEPGWHTMSGNTRSCVLEGGGEGWGEVS